MSVTAKDILGATCGVTKLWTKQRRAEDRRLRSRESRRYVYSARINFSDVADAILPAGYLHASGDGRYTVAKRQFFYACREAFKLETGRELQYPYFANTLLLQYMNRHPEAESWKVTADPRGTLTIPNCGHEVRVPCGTLQIDDHLRRANADCDPFAINAEVPIEWPSLRHGHRFQAVLYIEKEGFEPVLKEAGIAERFDLAILSCKGQSVVAARRFVDEVCRVDGGVPLFVVHDFDKYGFEISERLTSVSDWAEENGRVSYRFKNRINVTDFGLNLTDVQKYKLQEESCRFTGRFGLGSITTEEERQFLQSGRRVELNAFTAPQFIEWLETKLTVNLPTKFIPDDEVLSDAWRRATALAEINRALGEIAAGAIENAQNAKLPRNLKKLLQKSSEPWDRALYNLACGTDV